MDFEIYCDEAFPDVFSSEKTDHKYLMIGGLWIPAALRNNVKQKIDDLRQEHGVWGEIKWTKISPSALTFYKALIDLFIDFKEEMRFRCIAVNKDQVSMHLHAYDAELGFYKFYYQLIHHWIFDFNSYRVFTDTKSNRDPNRLKDLHRCLSLSNISASITSIQALHSNEVVLIQLCDLLLGAAGSRMNGTLRKGSAKESIIEHLENRLSRRLGPTYRTEEKFNIFRILLGGGW